MLSLLEALRSLIVSGHEPAPYQVACAAGGGVRLSLAECPEPGSLRLEVRRSDEGYWLGVSEHGGYRVEQFCRRLPGGRWEWLPEVWRPGRKPAPSPPVVAHRSLLEILAR
jgi:hypothetical protein